MQLTPLTTPQSAHLRLSGGRVELDSSILVTPLGLLAVGGLVAAILWSVPPIIRAAGAVRNPR